MSEGSGNFGSGAGRGVAAGPAPVRRGRPSILRLRAGAPLALVLVIVSFMIGRWTATLLSLGWGWAAVIGVVAALAIAIGLMRLPGRIYALAGAVVTALVVYTAYDFARNAMDWSSGTAIGLGLIPGVLVGAAFWDFRRLTREVTAWVDGRI